MKRFKFGFWAWARVWTMISLLASFALAGQAARPISEKELQKKLKLYASISTLEVDFKQTKTLKDMNLHLKSEGHLRLQRPDHLVWEITQPSSVLVSLDGNDVVIRTGKGSEAQTQRFKINEMQSDQAAKSLTGLMTWLTLDSKALTDQYNVYAMGHQSFRFEPKEKKSSPFESLEMVLGVNGQLNHLTLHEFSGDLLDIEFGKPKLTFK